MEGMKNQMTGHGALRRNPDGSLVMPAAPDGSLKWTNFEDAANRDVHWVKVEEKLTVTEKRQADAAGSNNRTGRFDDEFTTQMGEEVSEMAYGGELTSIQFIDLFENGVGGVQVNTLPFRANADLHQHYNNRVQARSITLQPGEYFRKLHGFADANNITYLRIETSNGRAITAGQKPANTSEFNGSDPDPFRFPLGRISGLKGRFDFNSTGGKLRSIGVRYAVAPTAAENLTWLPRQMHGAARPDNGFMEYIMLTVNEVADWDSDGCNAQDNVAAPQTIVQQGGFNAAPTTVVMTGVQVPIQQRPGYVYYNPTPPATVVQYPVGYQPQAQPYSQLYVADSAQAGAIIIPTQTQQPPPQFAYAGGAPPPQAYYAAPPGGGQGASYGQK